MNAVSIPNTFSETQRVQSPCGRGSTGAFRMRLGAISYWSCQSTHREALRNAVQPCGLDSLLPDERAKESALKAALMTFAQSQRQAGGGDRLVLPHTSTQVHGYEVRRFVKEAAENEVPFEFSLATSEHNGLIVTAGNVNEIDFDSIKSHYQSELHTVTGAQVGQFLVRACAAVRGTCLRPNGGLYFVPSDAAAQWQTIANAVESAGANKVWIGTLVADANSLRMIRDAIVAEIEQEASLMRVQVADGDLGKRALKNRIDFTKALRDKVSCYEGLLSESLGFLGGVIDEAEQAASDALAAEEAGEAAIQIF